MMPFSIGPVTVETETLFFAEVYHGRWIRAIARLCKASLANVFYLLTDLKGPIRPTLCYHATSSSILYKPRSYGAIHFNISSFDLFGIVNGAPGLLTVR